MSRRTKALGAAAAAALMGSFAVLGIATAAADPDNSADLDTLARSVSKGYDLSNCTAQQLTDSGELAALLCGQSPDSNGPANALYALFDNANNLASSFSSSIKDLSMATCGDAGESPTTWRQGSAGQTAGRVACGTHNNAATIIWTTDSKNVLGHITASNGDLDALYQWWRTKG
ncbi:MAG: serine/threonine protein kinase [Mycobacterium sp.]|uniref:serine/threonine protein kinase n=1 Tax=Mycobacterium sp. TaxID=1785 RepID=UPI00283ED0A9|nr:serine/threonine protein kinase [Mycobacterium sp.]